MVLSPFAFRRPGRPKLGVITVPLLSVVAVVLMFTFARTHWLEWSPVTMFLLSPSLLGFYTRRQSEMISVTAQ